MARHHHHLGVATGAGTAADPTSGSIGSPYQETIESAFQAWAQATGLSFVEVSDPSKADIQIGWGDFNTASTEILGYTSYESQNGQFMPGPLIRLEDPSQDPFTDSGLTYFGTNAQLYQVALHEIGHALGLADNSDPNSVMYPFSEASNRTLDATDIGAIQMLYGLTGNGSASQGQGSAADMPLMGTESHVTVSGWFASLTSQIQEITTADGVKLDGQVAQLVEAMATYAADNRGFDRTAVAHAPNDPTLQNAIAAAWHH
jgi:hypothetical protein